jgi:phenylacetate-CoA ligase
MGGTQCSQGHLHYEVSAGLVEFVALDAEARHPTRVVDPGEAGSLVATPFAPYRQTTLLIRYNTEDVAIPLAGPLDCEFADFPASSRLLGKRRLSVCTEDGWVFPRQVIEALEALDAVPLPARFAMSERDGRLALTSLVRTFDATTRRDVLASLERQGIDDVDLELVDNERRLAHPYPLRNTQRESMAPVGAAGSMMPIPVGIH